MKKVRAAFADFVCGKVKNVELKLVSSTIERNEPVSKEFRQALKLIAKFYEDNKRLRAKDYLVRPSVQAAVIALGPTLRRFRKLRVRWTAEVDQNLQAMHSLDAEPDLKRVMEYRRHPERFLKGKPKRKS